MINLNGDVLICSQCDGTYLHHYETVVYDRKEDSEMTAVTEVRPGRVHHAVERSDSVKNPSSRRHGVVIRFTCEGCEGVKEITVVQHKGQTFIKWEP